MDVEANTCDPTNDNNSDELTLSDLRNSNNPALQRIAKRAAENMTSSAYTSHNSHHSAHTDAAKTD